MPNTIEMTKSDFGGILGGVLDPCSSLLPGEEPIPGTVPPDPEGCQHWIDALGLSRAADVVIGRTLGQQRWGEALSDSAPDAVLASNTSQLQRCVDDVCAVPPRWPLMWPPPRRRLDPGGLTPLQLLITAARFQAAADAVGDNALQPELAAAADRLFDAGLSRFGAGRGET